MVPQEGKYWFCEVCDTKAVDVLQLVQMVSERQKELEDKFTKLDKKLTKIANDIITKMLNFKIN